VYIVSVSGEKIPSSGNVAHRYYEIFIQTSTNDRMRIGGFNFTLKDKLEQYANKRSPVSLTWIEGPKGPTFDRMCQVTPILNGGFDYREVSVPQAGASAKTMSIASILAKPDYDQLYIIEGTVSFGDDPLLEVNTYEGLGKVKNDCYVEDSSGISRFKVWESTFTTIKNQQKYRFTRVRVKSHGEDHLATSKFTKATLMKNDLKELKGPQKCIEASDTQVFLVSSFITMRKVNVSYECLACDKAIPLLTAVAPVTLTCADDECAAINTVKEMEPMYSVDVLFKVDGERKWGIMNSEVIKRVVNDELQLSSVDSVREHLMALRNMQIKLHNSSGKIVEVTMVAEETEPDVIDSNNSSNINTSED
jgi:hypothetical protein